ncbi:MAG: hypothetical protein DLM52_09660, partial [Chthoniobacterales bacterium]
DEREPRYFSHALSISFTGTSHAQENSVRRQRQPCRLPFGHSIRCSGEADGEGMAEVAGLALVAAFLRVRCGVAEGEAVAEVSAGLASVLAAAFL